MDATTILQKLNREFNDLNDFVLNVPDNHFFSKGKKETWSIAEHLHHLTLTITPLISLFKKPPSLLLWGFSNNPVKDYATFENDYKRESGSPWKAFSPFIPLMKGNDADNTSYHACTKTDAVQQFALLTGGQINELPKTAPINPDEGKEKVIQTFNGQWKELTQLCPSFDEQELNKYQVPLPYMGLVTLRQILYFTIFHTRHHHDSIKKIALHKY